jgi:HprK-related kinase B
MSWLQNQDWLICHAAGLQYKQHGLGMAGFSGGGKSTLMLKLLEDDNSSYLTNDRLFVRVENMNVIAAGIAKLPRVNPGTIVHNPRLQQLITEQQKKEYLALPSAELWDLEEKYDVMIDEVYGANRIIQSCKLDTFIVLNWQRNSNDKLSLEQIELECRPDLLSAIMKSPGPFYQYTDGQFFQDTMELDKQKYLHTFKYLDVYEVSGGIDFDRLTMKITELLNK